MKFSEEVINRVWEEATEGDTEVSYEVVRQALDALTSKDLIDALNQQDLIDYVAALTKQRDELADILRAWRKCNASDRYHMGSLIEETDAALAKVKTGVVP